MRKSSVFSVRNLTKIAILGVLAYVLMFMAFPLPFIAPPFYKMDFSEIPVLIGGFALGPISAILIEGIKIILNLLFSGTTTMFVGEASNFIVGCAMVIPSTIIYRKNKTKQSAIKALIIGTISMALVGLCSNYLAVIPAYINIMGFEESMILGMAQAIFPFIDNIFELVLFCTTPFNLIKGVSVSFVTALIYKHVSPLIK